MMSCRSHLPVLAITLFWICAWCLPYGTSDIQPIRLLSAVSLTMSYVCSLTWLMWSKGLLRSSIISSSLLRLSFKVWEWLSCERARSWVEKRSIVACCFDIPSILATSFSPRTKIESTMRSKKPQQIMSYPYPKAIRRLCLTELLLSVKAIGFSKEGEHYGI